MSRPLSRMTDAEWSAFVADCLARLNRWGFQSHPEARIHEIAPDVLRLMGLGRVVARRGGVVERAWTFEQGRSDWQLEEALGGRR